MKLKKYTVALTAVINEVCIGWSQENFYLVGTQAEGGEGVENLVGESTGDTIFSGGGMSKFLEGRTTFWKPCLKYLEKIAIVNVLHFWDATVLPVKLHIKLVDDEGWT